MKNNNHLVIVILISVVSLVLFGLYSSINYDGVHTKSSIIYNDLVSINNNLDSDGNVVDSQDETIKDEEKNNDDEIALGENLCVKSHFECPSGTVQQGDKKCYTESKIPYTYYTNCGGGTQESCVKGQHGTWTPGHGCNCKKNTGYTSSYKYYSEATVRVCDKCADTYDLIGGTCVKCKLVGAKSDRSMVSVEDGNKYRTWCIEGVWNNSRCANIHSPVYGKGKSCITAQAACGKSTNSVSYGGATFSKSISVSGPWKEVPSDESGVVYLTDSPKSESELQADAWIYSVREGEEPEMTYGKCDSSKARTEPDGRTSIPCTNVHVRGRCGAQPLKVYSYCCVDNQFIGTSTEAANTSDKKGGVKWADHVLVNHNQTKNGKNGCAYYFGDNYTLATNPDGTPVPQNKCSPPEIINRCDSKPKLIADENNKEETTACEEEVTLKFNEGEECSDSNIKNSFYTINCTRTVKANFDYGDDGDKNTVRELYKGQGFKYSVNVKTMIECEYNFNAKNWKESYNNILGRLRTIDTKLAQYYEEYNVTAWLNRYNELLNRGYFKKNVNKDVYKLWNILSELIQVVDAYNKYEPNSEYNEQVTLGFSYNVNGKTIAISPTPEFVRTVVSEGKYVYSNVKTLNLGVNKKLIPENPKNYKKNTNSNPRVVKLIPKELYINTTTGDVQTSIKNGYSGGNRIYLNYDTDAPQTINPVNIELSGFFNIDKTIKNNQCTIKVKDLEILYRPIDISNPFINNEWTPGSNWVNSDFDFRNTIHANIWGLTGCNGKYVNDSWGKCT